MKIAHIINLGLISLAAFVISACSTTEGKNTASTNTKPVPVKLTQVKQKNMAIPIHAVGIVSSALESSLSFKTGGIIKKFYVSNGQEVKKNQLLAELDLSEIKAAHNKALAAYKKSERELKRMKNLYKDKVTTLESLENTQTTFDVAVSDLEIVAFNLNYSKILAPSDGVILDKSSENGELIGAGQSVLRFGSSKKNWVIQAGLVDKQIVRVNIGDQVEVNFDAYPGSSFSGEVSKIASAPNAITSTYNIEVSLIGIPKRLKKGFVAKINIAPSEQELYTLIPIEALIEAEEEEGYIYKVENQRAKKFKVKIESIIEDQVLVSGDVSVSDKIVIDGSTEINEESILLIQ